MLARPIDTIEIQNTLGECVLWNIEDSSVWWTDIEGCSLYRLRWPERVIDQIKTPERLASFGFVQGSHRLVAGFESGFALFDPESGEVQWLAPIEPELDSTRLNDGRVDRQGRFWCGSMVEDAKDFENGTTAKLYSLNAESQHYCHLNDIHISNGLSWSPDSKTMYFADSPRREICAFDFEADTGSISNKRVFARTEEGAFPDGATVDSDGNLWSAHWGAGKIVCYNPAGSEIFALPIPAIQPSCVAFGGKDLDLLFVTSARLGLEKSALQENSQEGNLFVFETSTTGLPESRFAGISHINLKRKD